MPLPDFLTLLHAGHDGYAPVCRTLYNLLCSRGHKVWADFGALRGGADWTAEMQKGIDDVVAAGDNGRFVYLMAPYGVRRREGNGERRLGQFERIIICPLRCDLERCSH